MTRVSKLVNLDRRAEKVDLGGFNSTGLAANDESHDLRDETTRNVCCSRARLEWARHCK